MCAPPVWEPQHQRVLLTFLLVGCGVSGCRKDAGAEERHQGELSHLLSVRWNIQRERKKKNCSWATNLYRFSPVNNTTRLKNTPQNQYIIILIMKSYLQESFCCCCCCFLSKTLWWGRACSWGDTGRQRTHLSISHGSLRSLCREENLRRKSASQAKLREQKSPVSLCLRQ